MHFTFKMAMNFYGTGEECYSLNMKFPPQSNVFQSWFSASVAEFFLGGWKL
jgi:hypothetical protein